MTLLAAALLAAACGRGRPAAPVAGPPQPEPFPAPQRLYYDNGGGVQDSLRLVIRDEAALRTHWERATSRQPSPPAPPAIDFGRDMVVLVATGRMTPEDQVQVDSATVSRAMSDAGRMEPVLHIHVRTIRGCRRFATDAYPVEIVRLRRFDGPIRFQERIDQAEGCRDDAPGG
jgi:hypothetical protein